MEHTVTIIVYGGGEIFREYFNAIAAAVGGTTYMTLWRLSVLLAGATAIFSAVFRRDFLTCIRWFGLYYLVFYIIFTPKVDVKIIDRTNSSPTSIVSNVPLGLGVVAHLTTVIGDALTQLTDKIFSMPDDLRYSRTGMMMASRMVLASRQFQITDSILNGNMNRFMVQCVYWPILLGHYTMEDLAIAPNTWEFIASKASSARTFVYENKTDKKKAITVCKDGVVQLKADLDTHMDQVVERHASRIFSSAAKLFNKMMLTTGNTNNEIETTTPIDVKAQLLKYLPIAYGYLLGASSTVTDILQQNIVANAIVDGTLHFGMTTNSPNAITSYTVTKAQEQQRLSQDTIGFLAGYWLPIMKNVFEAIMYGCFIFIVLLGVFPFGASILKNYVYTLCWLQAWSPLYAIINLVCSYYAKGQSMGATPGGFVLKNISGLTQVNHDMASLAGYLTMSVPFIAAGLVRGMAGTMTHVAQFMGGVSQSAGAQAAGEAVAGNIRMGITEMRNNSAFNFTSNQQELRGRMSSGMNYQLPSGESINFMPDGSIAVDRGGTISNLGVDVNLAKSVHSSAMQQADHAYNTARSESVAAGENYQAGMKKMYEFAEQAGNSTTSGKSWTLTDDANVNKALSNVIDSTQQFAKEQGISYEHAKQILSRVSGGLGIDGNIGILGGAAGGVGAKANLGIEGSIQDNDTVSEQKRYRYAEDHIKKTGYSESIDLVQRASIGKTFNATNEQGAKLVESMGGSFDTSNHLRRDSETHYQEAISKRNIASYAVENAANINVNAAQNFFDFLRNQSGTNGRGKMGAVMGIGQLKNPETAMIYANQFTQAWIKQHLSTWGQGMPHSQHDIKQIYQHNAKDTISQGNIELQKQQIANNQQVRSSADRKGLTNENLIDTSVKSIAENRVKGNEQLVQQQKERMVSKEAEKAQKFLEEDENASQYRGHIIEDAIKSDKSRNGLMGIFIADKTPSEKIKDKIDE